jgi:hypothetical protein
MTLKEMFDAADDEFLKFEHIESPRHPAPDLCAFLMLHDLAPAHNRGDGTVADMIAGASHDEIWLATDVEALEKVATPEIIRDLARCGVRLSESEGSLCMFV